jgi:putative chitinase
VGSINRKFFYDHVRLHLFDGKLRQSQVDGLNLFLDRWEKFHAGGDTRWLAYILATTHHETARTFQPIEEFGKGKGHPYGLPDKVTGKKYYGRGYVQLTWKANYENFTKILKVDLVNHPEKALNPDIALRIIFFGMTNGNFTGKELSNYFHGTTQDWNGARKIVNGTDKAALIASYALKYYAAISILPG